MKNLFRIFAVVAAAAMTFACSDDNGAGVDGFGTHTVTFIAGGDDTRTEIVENGESVSYKWTAGDEERFHVYENGTAAKTTTVEFSDDYKFATVTATFDNTDATEFTYTATVAAKLSSAGNPLIPAEQTPAETSFDPAADVLVADPVKADAAVSPIKFRFARVAAVNKVTFKGFEEGETVKTVELTSDKNLSQYFTGVDASGEPKYSFNSRTLTLTVDRAVSDGAVAVYFTSAPVESTSFEVRVVTDKNIYKKELALSAEKTLAFTLDRRTGFTVNLAGRGEPIAEDKVYTLVKTQDDLYSGATYIIVATKFNYAMGQFQGGNNHPAAAITKGNSDGSLPATITISSSNNVLPVVIESYDNAYTMQSTVSHKYLYTNSKSANRFQQTDAQSDDGAKWNIKIEETAAIITNVFNTDRGYLMYNANNNNPIFNCYQKLNTNSDYSPVALYVDKTTCVEDTTPRIIASADVVNVSGDGETYDEVTVSTKYVEGAVTVTVPAEDEDWLGADITDGKIYLVVGANTTGEERTAVLTLSAEGAESVAITVKQAAIVPEITIAEADKTLSVPAEGVELKSIKVTTANLTEDVKVTVKPASEWLVADYHAADGTLDITVNPNTDAAERTATVTLSANGVSAAVEITQAGKSDSVFKLFDFTNMSYGSGSNVTPETQTPIEIAFGKGSNTSNNVPKYYTNSKGNAIRVYTGNTVTVSGGTITQIDITYGSTKGGTTTANPSGTSFDDANANGTAVWKGSATSVAFTFGGTTWISSIKVTYAGSGEPSGPTQLATPEVTATSTDSSVTLSWGGVSGADGYVYKIGDNPEQTTPKTSVTVNNLSEGTYEWSVKAISNDPANYTDSEPKTGSVTVSNGGSTGGEPIIVKPGDFGTGTTYALYQNDDWIMTFGSPGNTRLGSNATQLKNSKMVLGDNYAVAVPFNASVTSTTNGWAALISKKMMNVSSIKIEGTYTDVTVSVVYSTDGTNWVKLEDLGSNKTFTSPAGTSAYYAIVVKAGTLTTNSYINNCVVTFN